jgi:hypothetical protein
MRKIVKLSDFIKFNEDCTVKRHDVDIVKICLDHSFDNIVSLGVVLFIKQLLSFNKLKVKAASVKVSR